MIKSLRHILIGMFVSFFLISFVLPVACGFLSFATTFGGTAEQDWLNDVTDYLRELRSDCTDPELNEVLDYTIRRYDRIGPFDVAVSRCDWYPKNVRILGTNNPLVPGVTIDLDVVNQYPIHAGARILIHEALHDYPPYLGHKHINPVLNKWEMYCVQR